MSKNEGKNQQNPDSFVRMSGADSTVIDFTIGDRDMIRDIWNVLFKENIVETVRQLDKESHRRHGRRSGFEWNFVAVIQVVSTIILIGTIIVMILK